MENIDIYVQIINKITRRKCRHCSERIKNLVGENCQGMTLRNKSGPGKIKVYLVCRKQEEN